MYSAAILEHFHHPRNVGEIAAPSAVVEVANPVCGDTLKLWARVSGQKVVEAKFKAAGCVPAVACGSWVSECIHGQPLGSLRRLSPSEIESALGGLPPASKHAAALAAEALHRLLQQLATYNLGHNEP